MPRKNDMGPNVKVLQLTDEQIEAAVKRAEANSKIGHPGRIKGNLERGRINHRMNKYNQKWKREVTWAETYWYTENDDIVTSAWKDSNGKGWVGRAFSHKYGEIEIFKRDTFSEIMKHTHTINLGQETEGPVITNLNRKVSENLVNSPVSESKDTAKLRARIKALEEQTYEFKRMIDNAWVGTMAELINLTLTSKCKYMLIKLPQEKDCEKK